MKGGAGKYLAALGTVAGLGGAALLRDLRQKEVRAMFYLRRAINRCLGVFFYDKFTAGTLLPEDKKIIIMKDLLRYLNKPIIKRVGFECKTDEANSILVTPLNDHHGIVRADERIIYNKIENKKNIIDNLE